MLHTGGCIVHVKVLGQIAGCRRGLVGQDIDDLGQPIMKSCHNRVDLDPVAGGQQQCFRNVLALEQLLQNRASVRA